MNWKNLFTSFFTYTRKDRVAILLLITIILFFLFSNQFIHSEKGRSTVFADSSWIAAIRELELQEAGDKDHPVNDESLSLHQYDRPVNRYSPGPAARQLFIFDPNTASANDWKKLGLKDRTIQIILNYTRKGGQFRKAADLQRIYSLSKTDYEAIAPYISIPSSFTAKKETDDHKKEPTARPSLLLDINTADSTAFIALPAIGVKLAARIIHFREKLGGFYSIDQVAETFGLPDSGFQKIKPFLQLNNPVIRKININTATVEELKAHPYIRYGIANPIISYRNEHGAFKTVEDLKKLVVITDAVYSKLSPYLTVE